MPWCRPEIPSIYHMKHAEIFILNQQNFSNNQAALYVVDLHYKPFSAGK